MAGDGNFKWYWAGAEDAERWHGNEDSREAAIVAGRSEFGRDEFWICECDKAVMTANFHEDFIAERIMDDLTECNEECFDEEFDGEAWPQKDAACELEKAIQKAVEEWLVRFPAKTWCFGETRSHEKIKALTDA